MNSFQRWRCLTKRCDRRCIKEKIRIQRRQWSVESIMALNSSTFSKFSLFCSPKNEKINENIWQISRHKREFECEARDRVSFRKCICLSCGTRPLHRARRFYCFYYVSALPSYGEKKEQKILIYWFCRRTSGDEIHKPVIIHIKTFYCCITYYYFSSRCISKCSTLNKNTQSPLIGHYWQAFGVFRSRS